MLQRHPPNCWSRFWKETAIRGKWKNCCKSIPSSLKRNNFYSTIQFYFIRNIMVGGGNIYLVHGISIINANKNAYQKKFLTLTKELWLSPYLMFAYIPRSFYGSNTLLCMCTCVSSEWTLVFPSTPNCSHHKETPTTIPHCNADCIAPSSESCVQLYLSSPFFSYSLCMCIFFQKNQTIIAWINFNYCHFYPSSQGPGIRRCYNYYSFNYLF